MRKILAIFISLIISFYNISANADNIVAIVDKSPITASDIKNIRKLIGYFGGMEEYKHKSEKEISKMLLDAAIADKVVENYANTSNIIVTESEIDNTIKTLAEEKNMDVAGLRKHIENQVGVSIKEFRHKIKTEILRSRIIRGVVARNIEVSEKEVENLVLSTNFRDASLDLMVFTAKNNSERSYKRMKGLKRRIRNCNQAKNIFYKSFADLTSMSTKLSMLSPLMQNVVKEIPINNASDVIEDGSLRIIVVCSKEIDNMTDQDSNNLINFLGSKKLQIEAQKFLQDLRKKAYIKIID